MRMLVTGALGLVGSESVRYFTEKGWDVIGIDNNGRSKFFGVQQDKFPDNIYDIDIRDASEMRELFENHYFDAIIHAAAQPSHDYAKDHVLEDFTVNALGTVVLLELTRTYCPNATFVHVSTDKVYGENMVSYAQIPFTEAIGLDFAGQRSLFGCSKTAADIYVQEYGNYFGMSTVCFRPGCITGKKHKGAELHGFLAYLAQCIKEEKPYTIFGDGSTVRDQIHVYDLVSAFDEFIQDPSEGAVYNMGGGPERALSIKEAISKIEEATGKKAIINYGDERRGDRRWDIHDVSKFRGDYPRWDYKYSLTDIINELCGE